MSCAIDTNVLLDLVAGDQASGTRAAAVLEDESRHGGLVISPPVYAECLAHPGWRQRDVDALLRDTRIGLTWDLSQQTWVRAGLAFAQFAERRRKDRGAQPRRLLVDLLIAAHALEVGGLITRDSFFSKYFPQLRIVQPLGR